MAFPQGDPYIGNREEELKTKNIRIQELEAEVKKLKARVNFLESRSYSRPPGGAGPSPLTGADKKRK